MFYFFKRKNAISDIAWLGVDIHSHLLPGIDDGAEDIDQSLTYIRQLQELGFSRLICTPHIYEGLYPNSPDTILPVLKKVQAAVKEAGLSVEIDAAAEYMTGVDFLPVEGLLTLPENFILIEMSYTAENLNIDRIIFELQLKGYKVILAHPERYGFYYKHKERYHRLKELGCFLQLNMLSVLGYYGKNAQVIADYLLKNNLYDFAGTDLHHDRQLLRLSSAISDGTLYKRIGNYEFKNKEMFNK